MYMLPLALWILNMILMPLQADAYTPNLLWKKDANRVCGGYFKEITLSPKTHKLMDNQWEILTNAPTSWEKVKA